MPPWGLHGEHGVMRAEDWVHVIDQLARLGTRTVQFIGGEPTLYTALPDLIGEALRRGPAAVRPPERLCPALNGG